MNIGEAVTEIEAERAPEVDCDCKEGMFPGGKIAAASRRQILRGGGLLTAAAAILPARAMAADTAARLDPPWSVPGRIAKSDYGTRASFEKVMRLSPPAVLPPSRRCKRGSASSRPRACISSAITTAFPPSIRRSIG